MITLLLAGIRNAWDMTLWIVIRVPVSEAGITAVRRVADLAFRREPEDRAAVIWQAKFLLRPASA